MRIAKSLFFLLGLSLIFSPLALADGFVRDGKGNREASAAKKYPPYPDVWDWVIPFPARATQYIQADLQANGDVRISYRLKSKNQKKLEEDFPDGGSYATTFFARQAVRPQEDIKSYHLSRDRQVTLASGKVLKSVSRFKATNGCFDRLDAFTVLEDDQGKTISRMNLYYLLSKPQRFTVYERCYDGADFTYQVEAVPANLVTLEDGTFLVVDGEHGLVIRFDEQFKTKSSLLNRRLFAFDSTSLNVGDPKGYGSREEGNRDWQGEEDDLYRYLMSLKERK